MEEQGDFEQVHGFNIKLHDRDSKTLQGVIHDWKHNMGEKDLNRLLRNARHAGSDGFHMEDHGIITTHHSDGSYTIRKKS
ncbi:hypothetical protein A2911_02665 [Candidatus Nomurabacteria bacterium RIFCSPLOWO2_01_FULL_40_15]|uniref:Uncharacterized protein n=1 Tax=Candidatus Nomurabacteria bacterium RIFCSPLOWO2_01_FULL_40_15 TaxID=1801772 RepID=A0A1F6X669_9BACT|nr:MAG: hypothetical protein A2911_02665 [Candidatus Nomurabacteria bacterium RIFCSPLOWO2_01_FULL_40_15]